MPLYPARNLPFYNVNDFGASPGNTASINDSAFAAAIAALPTTGGVIVVPNLGTYKISQSIIIDADNVALVGYGRRGSAPTIQIDSGADPTWTLVVGNTKNVNSCLVQGLTFTGRNSTTSTGGGILFRCREGAIKQTKVYAFGGKGISLIAQTSTIYDVLLEDVLTQQCGMNAGSADDNLVIDSTCTDSDIVRLISWGDVAVTTTRNAINNTGSNNRFIDCHVYNMTNNGYVQSNGDYNQLLGGTYESAHAYGVEALGGTRFSVEGASFFLNSFADLALNGVAEAVISGCMFAGTNNRNIVVTGSSSQATITSNRCRGNAIGVQILSGASKIIVADNLLDGSTNAIQCAGTHCAIHDNIITGGIAETTGANNNILHDNDLQTGSITIIGAATKVRNNPGYNPVGQVTAPSFPATTVGVTNTTGVDVTAFVANGTSAITQVAVAGAGGSYVNTNFQIAASGWGTIRIPAGGSVKFTYAAGSPAWTWFGD